MVLYLIKPSLLSKSGRSLVFPTGILIAPVPDISNGIGPSGVLLIPIFWLNITFSLPDVVSNLINCCPFLVYIRELSELSYNFISFLLCDRSISPLIIDSPLTSKSEPRTILPGKLNAPFIVIAPDISRLPEISRLQLVVITSLSSIVSILIRLGFPLVAIVNTLWLLSIILTNCLLPLISIRSPNINISCNVCNLAAVSNVP